MSCQTGKVIFSFWKSRGSPNIRSRARDHRIGARNNGIFRYLVEKYFRKILKRTGTLRKLDKCFLRSKTGSPRFPEKCFFGNQEDRGVIEVSRKNAPLLSTLAVTPVTAVESTGAVMLTITKWPCRFMIRTRLVSHYPALCAE